MRMVLSWCARLQLAALSGVLTWLAGHLPWPLDGRCLLQGAVFGALVLVPWLGPVKGWAWRAAVLLAGGMVIQLMAVNLALLLLAHGAAFTLPDAGSSSGVRLPLAIPAAGIAGALLVAAVARVVTPVRRGWRLAALAAAAGLLGGALLASPQALPGGRMSGIVAWQVLVCAALQLAGVRPARPAVKV
jgi:hypothetical protein